MRARLFIVLPSLRLNQAGIGITKRAAIVMTMPAALTLLEPYRGYFILASLLLLGIGFWLAYRPLKGVSPVGPYVQVKLSPSMANSRPVWPEISALPVGLAGKLPDGMSNLGQTGHWLIREHGRHYPCGDRFTFWGSARCTG